MARILATSLAALLIVLLSSIFAIADQPIRVAGFHFSEFSFSTTVPEDARSPDDQEWPFDKSVCNYRGQLIELAVTTTESVDSVRPPAKLLSRSAYTCPLGSCFGNEIATKPSVSNAPKRTDHAVVSRPEKIEPIAQPVEKASQLATEVWATINAIAPFQLGFVDSIYRFATASNQDFQVAIQVTESSVIPSGRNHDRDDYWQYYSDCDRWNVVFQVPPKTAFARESSQDHESKPSEISQSELENKQIRSGSESLHENDEAIIFDSTLDTDANNVGDDSLVKPNTIEELDTTESGMPLTGLSLVKNMGLWLSLGGQGVQQVGTELGKYYRHVEFVIVETPLQFSRAKGTGPLFVSFSIRKLIVEIGRIRDLDGGFPTWIKDQLEHRTNQIIDSPVVPMLIRARRDIAIAYINQQMQKEKQRQAFGRYVSPRLKWTGNRLETIANWIEQKTVDQTAENPDSDAQLK